MSDGTNLPNDTGDAVIDTPIDGQDLNLNGDDPVAKQQEDTSVEAFSFPDEKSTPEQVNEFYTKLGKPSDAKDYDLELPADDDGVFSEKMRQLFHDNNITAAQGNAIAKGWNMVRAEMLEAIKASEAQAEQALKVKNEGEEQALRQEWGANADANVAIAKRAVDAYLPKEEAGRVIDELEKSIGTKLTYQFFYQVGKNMLEDGGANGGNTPQPKAGFEGMVDRFYPQKI